MSSPEFDHEIPAEFSKLTGADLKPIAVVAQCLDNQWLTRDLLDDMMRDGLSYADPAVDRRRREDARSEYLRAVLNAEQVVVNRAFFINNPAVYRDFVHPGPQRDTFRSLLAGRVLIPFLLYEESPGVPPAFTKDAEGWPAWATLIRDTRLHCLRLSWDRAENAELTQHHLYDRFRRFLSSLPALNESALATDLGLDRERMAEFKRVRQRVAMWSWDEESLTRETFYSAFVVADASVPSDGRFDRDKPFAGELKQLIDLRYATSLPDIIDRYPLIPADTLHRGALQEERLVRLDQPTTSPEHLAELLLRRRTFDLVQAPLRVSLTGLELSHVARAREAPEWSGYVHELQELLQHPGELDVRAQRVYDNYVRLARRLADLVGERRTGQDAPWLPIIKVAVEVLGASLTIVYAANPFVEIVGRVAQEVAIRASTAVVRLVIGSLDRRTAGNELGTGIELMRVRLAATGAAFADLAARLEASGLPVRRTLAGTPGDAVMDGVENPEVTDG